MERVVKFGIESLVYLSEYLKKVRPQSIFLVTGKKSYIDSGASEKLNPIIKHYNYFKFFNFENNPKVEDVERGIKHFNSNRCDLIIAVGGGSSIDMAKLINVFHQNETSIEKHILTGENGHTGIPLIAIPTTSGSGSESTHFAVVYVDKKKFSVAGGHLLPKVVLIDPSLTFSASAYLTAVTGLDALSQAIESFWSINSNELSKNYSREAIQILWRNLYSAVKENDRNAKEKISWAAHLAGEAINITKTTAPHAISYPFTTYFNIPHGHAVSLTLAYFLEFNYSVTDETCNDSRGAEFVRDTINELIGIIGCTGIKNAAISLDRFIKELGIQLSLKDLNIKPVDVKEYIIANTNVERMENNPRIIDPDDLFDFLACT